MTIMLISIISIILGLWAFFSFVAITHDLIEDYESHIKRARILCCVSIFLLVFGAITLINIINEHDRNYNNKVENQLKAKAYDYCFDKVKKEYKNKGPYIININYTEYNKYNTTLLFKCPNYQKIYLAEFENKPVNIRGTNKVKITIYNN